ncbi:RNA polymerase sigma-70 factor, ECF subfamily [Eubacterium uniforme]|uniref:RNA polymerase sigma-70 factor, ECF subfamily n=2 Tax=Eubacterium uniforme TaxID=39495 RepID=A0A1T4W117_9FIRM|nr:RNA polymerase sigma-70 factor, ECF subfamily [Eubacterium uniforme]
MMECRRFDDVEMVIREYGHTLFRNCFLMLNSKQDAEDVVQETFMKYFSTNIEFIDNEHRKAWLIKVSQNKCRDILRFNRRHTTIPLEKVVDELISGEYVEIDELNEFISIAKLGYKYKSVIMLHYIEGYSVEETAKILNISKSAVKMRLKRAREILKDTYEKKYS